MLRSLLLVSLAAALALLSGCATNREPDPLWVEAEVSAPSQRVLGTLVENALLRQNFAIGLGMDPAALKATSQWHTVLQPFSGMGYRERAEVSWRPLEGDQRWLVQVRVQKQENQAIANPTDPRYAEWEWVPDDVDAARELLMRIRSTLGSELELRSESARSLR
ncbi:MAG: hypothetical protein ACYS26_06015 [Planctomycetota bacterium]|jgi:hypothetical protein